ncbi:MAG: cyclohydrolase [Pseudomonadota bacterium]
MGDAMGDMRAATRRVALALDALRHGWPIRVDTHFTLLPAETGFGTEISASLMLISSARAATLKLTNQRDAAAPESPVLIRGADGFDLALARAIADPALDLATPMKGPFRAEPLIHESSAKAALELARLAGVLPAFLVNPTPSNPNPADPTPSNIAQAVNADDLATWSSTVHLTIAARAHLPISAYDDAEIVAFRARDDLREHVALIIGQHNGDRPPLVRLHSECLTGDILGSRKCDCGPQLDAALAAMGDEAAAGGWGILLYLRQEGRGIGLINKLRAYQLQDQGFDTVDANTRLGLPAEARDFPVAARMLGLLGVRAIRLMTNNPEKLAVLEQQGVVVTQRVPHQLAANPHNIRYLATKRDRAGHLL